MGRRWYASRADINLMKIIVPIEITESMFTTNVPYVVPNWSSLEDYETNDPLLDIDADLVAYPQQHLIYEAVQASGPNTEIGPIEPNTDTNGDGIIDSLVWVEYSATNPWQPFYGSVGNAAKSTTNIQYVITPGQPVTGIALFKIVGADATVTLESAPGVPVGDPISFSMTSSPNVIDWYTYFFNEIDVIDSVVDFALPLAGIQNPIITIDIDAAEGDPVELGEIILGESIDIGYTQKDLSLGIVDYSTKKTDTYGNISIIPRAFSQKANLRVLVLKENINYIARVLTTIRSKPIVWGLLDDVEFIDTVLIYGYLKDYNMAVPNPKWASLNIQIEGLT